MHGTIEVVPTRRDDGRVRWLTRLGPGEARGFAEAVRVLTPTIESALGPEVIANRAAGRGAHRTTALEPWGPARARWRASLAEALAVAPPSALLVTDVRQCYASIRPNVLAARLGALGAAPHEVGRVREMLERFAEHGVRGLPVGPAPSAILANAVLVVLDQRLRRAGTPHVRWVDDVVAFAEGRREILGAFDALRRGLDAVGLELNASKTEVLTRGDAIRTRLLDLRPSPSGASRVG